MDKENTRKKFNLEERTAHYGESVIMLCRQIAQDSITRPIIAQLIRSAASIGANYAEANGASSKRDFRNKIHLCKKEAQETKHWLRMLSKAAPSQENALQALRQETHELTLIFGKIAGSLKEGIVHSIN